MVRAVKRNDMWELPVLGARIDRSTEDQHPTLEKQNTAMTFHPKIDHTVGATCARALRPKIDGHRL